MTVRKRPGRSLWILSALAGALACVSPADRKIEEAGFLLDKAEYAEAARKAREALASEPENPKAKFMLASALIGAGFLGEGRTYLGLLADVLEERDPGQSNLQTFARIAPSDGADALARLTEARDILLSIPEAARSRDTYLQLYVARLFSISTINSLIGANSPDNVCNFNPSSEFRDGIPDDFDPDALTDAQAADFRQNLADIDDDRRKGGLPDDFGLNDRLAEMFAELTAAAGAAEFFKQQYGDPGSDLLCTR